MTLVSSSTAGWRVSKDKLIISGPELTKVKDLALTVFRDTHYLPEEPKEAQVFLAIQGLYLYLKSQGIEPQFTLKPIREDNGDTSPLDDLG